MCKGRTGFGLNASKAGRETSTTGAQRGKPANGPHGELAVVIEAWEDLPEDARKAILGAVQAFAFPSAQWDGE